MKQFYILTTLLILTFSQLNAQNYNQIIVGANNNSAIFSANIDGSNPTEISTSEPGWSFYGGVDSPNESKIYASWYYGIYVMDYDGNNWQQLYDYPSGGMESAVDIDIRSNDVYFISTQEDKLFKMKTDGSGLTTILNTLTYGSDLVLDTTNNYIYYSESISPSAMGIYRVNMDGTGFTTILPNTDISNFEIDFVNSKIYFSSGTTGSICDLDGSNVIQLFNFQIGEFAFDNSSNLLYFTDESNDAIKSSNLDGSNIQTIINSTDIYFDSDALNTPVGLILINKSILGVNNIELTNELYIYPNPTSDFIEISSLTKTENYTIYDILGTKIRTGIISNNEKINIQNLTNGLYYIKLKNGKSLKFIKE